MIKRLEKKIDSDEKLRNINNKVTLNKSKQIDANKKLTFFKKWINGLSKIKLISTKGLTKDLINGYSILNEVKYFAEDEPQNYLYFIEFLRILKQ